MSLVRARRENLRRWSRRRTDGRDLAELVDRACAGRAERSNCEEGESERCSRAGERRRERRRTEDERLLALTLDLLERSAQPGSPQGPVVLLLGLDGDELDAEDEGRLGRERVRLRRRDDDEVGEGRVRVEAQEALASGDADGEARLGRRALQDAGGESARLRATKLDEEEGGSERTLMTPPPTLPSFCQVWSRP